MSEYEKVRDVGKTYWISKWALRRGIYELNDCDTVVYGLGGYASKPGHFHRIGRDAWETMDDAVIAVRRMILAKIASCKRTEKRMLKLLDTYDADVPPPPLKEAP